LQLQCFSTDGVLALMLMLACHFDPLHSWDQPCPSLWLLPEFDNFSWTSFPGEGCSMVSMVLTLLTVLPAVAALAALPDLKHENPCVCSSPHAGVVLRLVRVRVVDKEPFPPNQTQCTWPKEKMTTWQECQQTFFLTSDADIWAELLLPQNPQA